MTRKNPNISAILQKAALDMYRRGKESFTINTFDHRGVSTKTFEFRVRNMYCLQPDIEFVNATQWKRVFRIVDLINAMKKHGDWK